MAEVITFDRPVRFLDGPSRIREGSIRWISRNSRGDWGVFVDYDEGASSCWVAFDQIQQ